jgi:hypothetical protein
MKRTTFFAASLRREFHMSGANGAVPTESILESEVAGD